MEPKSLGLEELILLRITFILLEGPVSLLLNFNYVPPPKVRLGGGGGGGDILVFGGGGGHIGFSADPVGVGLRVGLGVGVTNSCTHDIS